MTNRIQHHGRLTRRVAAVALASGLVLGACGGGSSDDAAGADDVAGEAVPAAPAVADSVALETGADVSSNVLPDLVVDDLNIDSKVNLRNYGVGDKPILLWLWAPH